MILPCCWFRFSHLTCVFSEEVVHCCVLLICIDVHIRNWGLDLLDQFSSCSSSPMSLNGLHMPLIDNCYDIIFLNIINISENSLSSPINHNFLLFWGNFSEQTNHKVDSASITWFSKSLTTSCMKTVHKITVSMSPGTLNFHEVSQLQKWHEWVHIWLYSQGFHGFWINLPASEECPCTYFLSLLNGHLSFQPRSKRSEISGKPCI